MSFSNPDWILSLKFGKILNQGLDKVLGGYSSGTHRLYEEELVKTRFTGLPSWAFGNTESPGIPSLLSRPSGKACNYRLEEQNGNVPNEQT